MRSLENKVALVTGAGSGIGQFTALAFGREGARVVVSDVDVHGGEETAQRIRQGGGQAVAALVQQHPEEQIDAQAHEQGG